MTVRAVLFDLDDTLLDWYSAVHSAWEAVCGEIAPALGGDPMSLREAIRREASLFWRDEAAVEHLRTRPLESREAYVRLALLAEGLDESPARAIAERSLDEMRERIALFHDALDTLDALRAAGLRLGLVTNGHAATQRHKIDRFAIEEHFDVIVVEGEFGKGKPHPEVFAHALAGVGAAPDETWMVGDNLYADIGGAKAAGIHGVWIHRERLQRPEEPHTPPDREIAHLDELLAALGL